MTATDPALRVATGSAPTVSRSPNLPADYRPGLDGIRAFAVGIVILFHLGYTFVPGGFIGVDVFFVLSGYLITGLLVSDVARHGRVRLSRFYARRMRRLLPASLGVLIATGVVGYWLLSPTERFSLGSDLTAGALYLANWHFSFTGGEYFQDGDVPSAMVHYWSLGIEEQFYLVWPAVVVLVALLTARLHRGRRLEVFLGVTVAAMFVSVLASLAASGTAVGYYGTHVRTYQLLAGAALALVARRFPPRLPDLAVIRHATTVVAVGCLAVLFHLAHRIQNATDYPGWDGIWVTLVTVTLIAAVDLGPAGSPGTRLIGSRPLAATGRLSYSLYIWHWPVLVFLPLLADRLGEGFGFLELRPVMVAVVVALALASYFLIEQPFRFHLFPTASTLRTVGLGLACSVLIGFGAWATFHPRPHQQEIVTVAEDWARAGPCPYSDTQWKRDGLEPCVQRDGSGPTIALVGDSHAQQWLPAIEKIAERRDATVVRATMTGCPTNDVLAYTTSQTRQPRIEHFCTTWRHTVLPRVVDEFDPDLTFLATRSYITGIRDQGRNIAPDDPEHLPRWRASWDWTLETLGSGSGELVVSTIDPTMPVDIPDCLLDNPEGTGACDFPADVDRRAERYNDALTDQVADHDATIIDPTRFVCPHRTCPGMIDGVVVRRDDNHLAVDFVARHTDSLVDEFAAAGIHL